jgi:hypothetical protein
MDCAISTLTEDTEIQVIINPLYGVTTQDLYYIITENGEFVVYYHGYTDQYPPDTFHCLQL